MENWVLWKLMIMKKVDDDSSNLLNKCFSKGVSLRSCKLLTRAYYSLLRLFLAETSVVLSLPLSPFIKCKGTRVNVRWVHSPFCPDHRGVSDLPIFFLQSQSFIKKDNSAIFGNFQLKYFREDPKLDWATLLQTDRQQVICKFSILTWVGKSVWDSK